MSYKLTPGAYYHANDTDYLEAHADAKNALVNQQKKCLPRTCQSCYFFRWIVNDNRIVAAQCAVNSAVWDAEEQPFDRRVKNCPLERRTENE